MKAAVLNRIPSALDIEEIEIDRPGPREVLVRTAAAGVCHSDLHFMEGKYRTPTPAVLGHEAAGVVEAVGEDVVGIAPGDHVISCLSVFCGHCEFCLSGRPHLCLKTATRRPADAPTRLRRGDQPVTQSFDLSAFAELMLVHEHALVKIRPDVPLDRAALVGCGVTTGLGAVFHTAKVEPGETVAVIGAGGIGLNCIQGARIAGAGRIIAVDALASKLELARSFGATDVVDASGGDAVEQVLELTGGGVHHAFEAIGLKVTCEQAFGMLRRGGTATIIGMVPVGVTLELPGSAFLGEKKLQGSLMGSNRFRIDMPRYLEMYLDGRLELDRLVSARRPLEEINEAYDDLKTGEVARSVLLFED
jgi:S-(hydroxymethyl)glutathione dehydrogenase / alcohol dehydrogenase